MVKIFRFLLVAVLVSSLILHVGYRRAEAIAPAIPFMAMVLSAVATGSAIGYMSYNANGKEIYVKMKGALKDGIQVTQAWVQRQIAEMHGVDLDSPFVHVDSSNSYVHINGKKYKFDSFVGPSLYLDPVNIGSPPICFNRSYSSGGSNTPHLQYIEGDEIIYIRGSFLESSGLYEYTIYYLVSNPESDSELGSGFDPSLYPLLFSGPALITNCEAVARANPDLVPIYEISDVKPEGFDEANATVQEIGGYTNGYAIDAEGNKYDVNGILAQASGTLTTSNGTTYNLENYVASGNYIQAANGTKIYISDITSKAPGSAKITTADGREYYLSKDSGPKVIDSTGNVIHMPPGEVLDALGGAKPTLDWSSYSDSYISTSAVAVDTSNENKGKKLLPGWLGSRLKQAGIDLGAGSVVDSVSNGRVNWTDASGVSRTTLVNTELTDALVRAGAAQKVTTNGRSVTIQNAQSTVINNAGATTEAPSINFGPDPGDPNDPNFDPGVVFDPSFDWGEEKEFDIQKHINVVDNLPLVNVVKGSSLRLVGANPVLSVPLSGFPGAPQTNVTVDFSQFDWIFTIMGNFIYFSALINSLILGLFGRRS